MTLDIVFGNSESKQESWRHTIWYPHQPLLRMAVHATDGNGYPLPTYPAGFYPVGWGFGNKTLPIGMYMVKLVYPVGIVGAGAGAV